MIGKHVLMFFDQKNIAAAPWPLDQVGAFHLAKPHAEDGVFFRSHENPQISQRFMVILSHFCRSQATPVALQSKISLKLLASWAAIFWYSLHLDWKFIECFKSRFLELSKRIASYKSFGLGWIHSRKHLRRRTRRYLGAKIMKRTLWEDNPSTGTIGDIVEPWLYLWTKSSSSFWKTLKIFF